MTVVSDSSSLIALARIHKLRLLAELYGRILIPDEVHHEVTVAGRGLPGAEEVRRADWIERVKPDVETEPALERACDSLGSGERGTIFLAKTLPADLALIDEWKARRVAREAGLSVLGCLGTLEAGARKGMVTDLREAYVELYRSGNSVRSQTAPEESHPASPHFSSIPRNGVGGARGMGFHGFEAASPLGGVAVRQKRPRMPSADMAGAFLICFWANLDCRPCRALCASSIT